MSARSTTGACAFLTGAGGSAGLVSWWSHRQGCAATSTAEAELVAISDCVRHAVLPLASSLSQICGEPRRAGLATDSAAALAAVERGYSASTRYLRKNHRASLAAVADFAALRDARVFKVDSAANVSDLLTKPLPPARFEELRGALGVHLRSKAPARPAALLQAARAAMTAAPGGPGPAST